MTPQLYTALSRSIVFLIFSLLSTFSAASCTYSIVNTWVNGFQGSITITNEGTTPINGWTVSWQYAKNKLTSSWNATLTGTNPFSATALDWNKTIQPGQSASFGVQGDTNGAAPERPTVSGAACNSAPAVIPTIAVNYGQQQGAFSITTAKTNVWQIQELVNTTWSTIQSGTGASTTVNYTRPAGTYSFRVYNCLTAGSGCATSSTATITIYPAAAFDSALWRIVSRADRKTLNRDVVTSNLIEDVYRSTNQHWRITQNAGSSSFRIKQEETGKCLTLANNVAALGTCGVAGSDVFVDMVRKPSVSQPGVYYVRLKTNVCARPNPSGVPTLGNCDSGASWYIEPVWYGERSFPSQYQINGLLLIKPTTNVVDLVHNINAQGTISQSIMEAATFNFKTNVKTWLERFTDGRVTWTGNAVVANEPIKSLRYFTDNNNWWQNPITSQYNVWNPTTQRFEPAPIGFDPKPNTPQKLCCDTNFLPEASFIPNDVQRFVPRGQYDTVQVLFTGGTVPGGWGYGPGQSVSSNYTYWTTVNGGKLDPSIWLDTTTPDPAEVFIHEMMHGYDVFYDHRAGLPLEEDYLHGGEGNQYGALKNFVPRESWMHWYRDVWLGTVIGSDDTYHGYGPRLFAQPTIRQFALTQPESVVKITQRTSGKCFSTEGGVNIPGGETPVVLSSTCNTDASSFVLQADGLLRHKTSGYCVHPQGGTPLEGTRLVFWGSCDYRANLAMSITDGGSIKNTSSGFCVHPFGGSPNPTEGTTVGLFNSCDEERLQFTFDRK